MRPQPGIATALVAIALALSTARAEVAISVSASVNTAELEAAGRFNIELSFEVEEPPPAPYRIRVAFVQGEDRLFSRDHSSLVPMSEWRAGSTIVYELPSLFPISALTSDLPLDVDVYVGFRDLAEGENLTPQGGGPVFDDMRRVATFVPPTRPEALSTEDEVAVLAAAEALKKEKRLSEAWDRLEFALRRSADYQQKARLRLAMEGLGHFPPRPINVEEEGIVATRIRGEKQRYLREVAGRLHDQKLYRGALAILDQVGGLLEEDGNRAEIGALADAERVTQSAEKIRLDMLRASMAADEEMLAALGPMPTWESAKQLRAMAVQLMDRGHHGAAYEIVSRAEFSHVHEVAEAALALKDEVRLRIGEGITEEEQAKVDAAWNHEAWGRLTWAASHEFIYIGPERLIQALIKKRDSTRRFDLAYVFQTDLFDSVPNPGGDRITVFFKELWDFNGGVGGGKIIDIGNAKPMNTGVRVDNGLLYHELTHNIYNVVPGYPGFTEGIANFGACFSFDVLAQAADSLHGFNTNLEAFEQDYAGRDLDYWRIQNYGPSAGFFLHFIEKYGKEGKRYRWQLYRQFFRDYNQTPLRDGRAQGAIRALAYFLVKAFGPEAFDDLIRFRFPLVESDRDAIAEEIALGDGHYPDWAFDGTGRERAPNSPANRDALHRELAVLRNSYESFEELEDYCATQLGVIHKWRVGGPFLANSRRSFAEIFPPEQGVMDFAARYEYPDHTALWRKPTTEDGDYVTIAGDGWVRLDYPYPANVSAYAHARLIVPTARPALLHLRTDDHFTVWVNRRLLCKMQNIGSRGSKWLAWRGNRVADELSIPIELAAGANALLIKVTNGNGLAGFVAGVTDPSGAPFTDLEVDTRAPEETRSEAGSRRSTGKAVVLSERSMRGVKAAVGGFTLKRRQSQSVLVGTATGGAVQWRKYTVRPGVPKDSPSNLGWLPAELTKKSRDFRLELELVMDTRRLPKLTVTFDGEGKKDGLSGWTVILVPDAKKFHARLERYDDLYYRSWNHEVAPAETYRLLIERIDGQLVVQLDDLILLEKVDVPPIQVPTATRIGFATWTPELGIARIRFQ